MKKRLTSENKFDILITVFKKALQLLEKQSEKSLKKLKKVLTQ